MKIIDRILLVVVGLLCLAVAAGCVMLAVNFISISDIIAFIGQIDVDALTRGVLLLVAVVLVFVGLKIVFARPKKVKIEAYTIRKSEDGDIAVSLKAIENTIKLAVAHYRDIKDVRINVSANDAGIAVSAKLAIPTGVVLPTLLDSFKAYLKDFVELHTGAPVTKIKLVATEYKPVDPDNERKKIASKEAKAQQVQKKQNAYAGTHATVMPKAEIQEVSEAEERPVVDVMDSIDTEDAAPQGDAE